MSRPSTGAGRARRAWPAALAVLLVAFALYRDGKVNASFDSLWTLHEAWSLVREGDLDLDEYRDVIPTGDYRVDEVGGRLRSTFPPGTALLAAPLAAVVDAGARALGHDPYARLRAVPPDHATTRLAKTLASVLVAAAAALWVPLGRRRGLAPGGAVGLALVFAFATPAFSLLSRGLWQHGPVVLCLTVALWLLAVGEERPWATAVSALPLAFAFVVRPTAAIPLVAVGAAVAVRWPRRLPAWLAAAGAVLVPFVLWSRSAWGAWLPPYHAPGRLAVHDAYLEALAANLVSPARGLLVFAPVVAFAAWQPVVKVLGGWGLWLARRRLARRDGALETAVAAACVAHWLAVSAFGHWWGGHGYGPRFMSDLLPLLLWLAVPAVAALVPAAAAEPRGPSSGRPRAASRAGRRRAASPSAAPTSGRLRTALASAARPAAAVLLAAAVGWGLFVNVRGARDWGPWRWHDAPVDLDRAPSRVWDWHDPPFLRTEG